MTSQRDHIHTDLLSWIEAVQADEAWPKVEGLLQKMAQTFVEEVQKNINNKDGIRIDTKSMVRDLGSGNMNADLQHFFTWNHRFIAMLAEKNRRAAVDTYDFVDTEMKSAMFNPKQMDVIASKRSEISSLDGYILDLGVYKGSSTRALARIFHDQVIHGFDSFEGLPEDWSHVLKGAFGDVKGILPDMPENVRLYKGWFDEVLPVWLQGHGDRPISLLRVDCDIYSSTKTIFNVLGSQIQSGTWIVFDELIGYRGWQDHEYKAFKEFQQQTGFKFEYVAFGLTYALGYVK